MPIKQADVAHYDEHGYVILRGLFSPALAAELLDRVDGLLAGKFDKAKLATCGPASDEHPTDPGRTIMQVLNFEFPPHDPILARFAAEPAIAAAAGALTRSNRLSVFQQQALLKQPGVANGTPWHQDDFYWESVRLGVPTITAWTPLLPSSAKNGTMWLMPDSHKLGLLPHGRANGVSKFHTIKPTIDHSKLIPLELAPGDVSLHHPYTIHGAPDNLGTQRRVGFAQHYREPAKT